MEDMLRLIMISMALFPVSLLMAAVITHTTYKGRYKGRKKALGSEGKKED